LPVPVGWFDRGVEALSRVLPACPPYYVCPLCLRGFTRQHLDTGKLTREHAPPRALGGQVIALTCHKCNTRAGTQVDREMLACERLIDFAQGAMTAPFRAKLLTEAATVNVDAMHGPEGFKIIGLPQYNNPVATRASEAEWNRLKDHGAEGFKFTLRVSGGRDRHAQVGWLRAAYLVAFAAFGYRYIFRSPLKPVRDQLADPAAEILPMWEFLIPDAAPTERRLIAVKRPASLKSLAVQMGRHLIFLPHPPDMLLYTRLGRRRARSGGEVARITISGTQFSWPREPQHVLDFRDAGAVAS